MASAISASCPSVPETQAMSAKTPNGVSSITIIVTFCMTTAPLSKILAAGSPSFSAMRMPMPISMAKTISGSTCASAMTLTGLSGTIERIMSTAVVLFGAGVGPSSIALASIPCPGLKKVPSASPSQTAICPVTTKSSMARPPTAPSLRKSPMAATPETSEKKMSGTTSIFTALMKKSPIHLIDSASGPHSRPVIVPSTSAAITRCQSGMANQNRSMNSPQDRQQTGVHHGRPALSRLPTSPARIFQARLTP